MNDNEKLRLIELDERLEEGLMTCEECTEYIKIITNKNFKEHHLLRS